jgi:prophage regulatory protein
MSSGDASVQKPAIRLLRLPEVCKAVGLGRAMIYRLQSENRFPRAVKISERAVGWVEHEVQDWLARRLEQDRSRPVVPIVPKSRPSRGIRRRGR